MAESLNVIALISGGKDSFYSLLHCLQNGHKVVALGNLYPAPALPPGFTATEEDEYDLNSFMYQTVGHTVIPFYEQALGIPLYRQPILGTAVQTGTSYGHSSIPAKGSETIDREADETESLVPLLMRIMANHPMANALSTGAILSTYQRTRIESVALRLGLAPLSYLWQYPILPPGYQASLLEDMSSIGLDARVVKVASGGLDESFLWQNIASSHAMRRVEKAMKRFGTDGDGAVLGEGGEFETLVIDGPYHLFKARIQIKESDRMVVREGGGSAWLRIKKATVVAKGSEEVETRRLRRPELLDTKFNSVLDTLKDKNDQAKYFNIKAVSSDEGLSSNAFNSQANGLLHWTVTAKSSPTERSISEEAEILIAEIKERLGKASLEALNIVSTIILLRRMEDFPILNKIYGTLFSKPNPPSRVTISCGDILPNAINIVISLRVCTSPSALSTRKALHVQSRSYWAPANIGPYSQAISMPITMPESSETHVRAVAVAGQIPLVPHTMILPTTDSDSIILNGEDRILSNFKFQTVLSLQHLWRIGIEMQVGWWTSVVAYLPRDTLKITSDRAKIASKAWSVLHSYDIEGIDNEDNDDIDLWEEKYHAGMGSGGRSRPERLLPNWSFVDSDKNTIIPPFFAIEVEELPRLSGIEWHAHLGIQGGLIKLYSKISKTGWVVYQYQIGSVVQSIIAVEVLESLPLVKNALQDALGYLDRSLESINFGYSSYVDASIFDVQISELEIGMIPCRSIWGENGRRLAAVFLYERL